MKFSKLLKFVLGLSGFFQFHADGEDGGGEPSDGPLDRQGATDALMGFLGDDGTDQNEHEDDSPEAAAERLAAEDAAAQEPAEEAPAEAAPDVVTIEVDGKPVTMTKAELAEAIKGQMRQADYTQKTMAAAEQTRQAQAAQQAAANERAQMAQQLNAFSIQTQGNLQQLQQQLTDQLWTEDPVRYLEVERSLKHGQAQLQEAHQHLGAIQQQQQKEQAEAQASYRAEQQQKLLAKLPAWSDPAKAQEEIAQLKGYLMKSADMTEQEVLSITDHRLILTARKAMQYDDLMARAGKAKTRVEAAPPKVERPGVPAPETRTSDGRTAAMKQLSKTGSARDAAAALMDFV